MNRFFSLSLIVFIFSFRPPLSADLLEKEHLEIKPQETYLEFLGNQPLEVSSDNNQFALKLYRQLNESADQKNKNLSFSPYSISSCLAMVYAGAEEETLKEMAAILNFKAPLEKLNQGFSLLNAFFNKKEGDATKSLEVNIQNSIWIQTGFPLVPQFLDTIGKYFKVAVHPIDFLRTKEWAREQINEYVRQKTHGKIVDLIKREDLSSSTKMVLASSIYLKGAWQKPFDEKLTKKQPFFITTSKEPVLGSSPKELTVEMMQEKGFYPYLKFPHFSAVELSLFQPMKNFPNIRFMVLLPDEGFFLDDLKNELSDEILKKLFSEMENKYLTLLIPKFKFTKSIALKNVLMKMGLEIPFTEKANFSGISTSKDLYLSQVSHEVFISVDEKGIEAAGATSASMNMKSFLVNEPEFLFRVDRPFIFLIYEKLTHSILFLGHLISP